MSERTIENVKADYYKLCCELGNLEYDKEMQKRGLIHQMMLVNQEGEKLLAKKEEPQVDLPLEVPPVAAEPVAEVVS